MGEAEKGRGHRDPTGEGEWAGQLERAEAQWEARGSFLSLPSAFPF